MSLQVWLPLTKDLRQQGLSSATIINNGASTNTAGKLGGCYSFNGSSNYLYTTGQGYFGNNYSFAAWVYTTSTSATQTIGCIRTAVGSGFSLFLIGGKLRIDPGGNNVQWTTSYTYPANTWFHLVVTYDGTTVKYYINGEYKQSYTTTINSTYWGNTLSFGASQANGSSYGNYLNGRLNDIRVYNHCLSLMEVKELAKGLVLHYPLNRQDWGQDNILLNTGFQSRYTQSTGWDTTKNGTQLANSWGGYNSGVGNQATVYHAHLKEFNGEWVYEYIKTANESWLGISQSGLQSKLTAGKKYTFSWEQYSVSGSNYNHGGLYYYKTGASSASFHLGSFSGTGGITGQWKKFSYTFTAPSDADYSKNMSWYIYGMNGGNGTLYMRHPKLEEGESATPWIPNLSDTLATTMGLNSTTEYDCSGFCNNGTRTGTFTWTSDTPKYAVSQNCLGTNYIYLTPPSTEIQTMAVWVKWNTIPSGQSVILVDNGSGIGLGLYSGGILCSTSGAGSSYAFSKANLVANTWYHFVVVKTGATTRKLYINGVEQTANSSSSNWSYSVNQLQLGKRSTTSDGFVGKLSDFRAYATALSADDVKSLYQNCATIDSDGTIRGQIRS